MKWPIVAELRGTIERARGGTLDQRDPLIREALEVRRLRAGAQTQAALDALDSGIDVHVEQIQGRPIGEESSPFTGPRPVFEPSREERAKIYGEVAKGQATPIALYHNQFITEAANKPRTEGDDRRAMRFLLDWCEKERIAPVLQPITRKVAIRFSDDLPKLAGAGQSPVTLNKYLRRLSRYWAWLVKREEAEANVWHQVTLPEPRVSPKDQERPFTDDEVRALLNGPAEQRMHDLMRIAALSGARLDAIVDLKVKDCTDGLFIFKPQKQEKQERTVPIHPDLEPIITRRTKGKLPEDDLFPEWPAPRKAGSMRERSFKASNQFTKYRREVGVEVVLAGRRRSLVNFHSFRRWFITKAEQADQAEGIIAAVVGHKRTGMTLGRYSAGPLVAQARRCVEAVRLPT